MTEVWRSALMPGYEVSNFGNVRSIDRVAACKDGKMRRLPGKPMSPVMSTGYKSVRLSHNGQGKTYRIHALVAAAFLDECPSGYVVDHIDEDKLNNHVSNLRWIHRGETFAAASAEISTTGGNGT